MSVPRNNNNNNNNKTGKKCVCRQSLGIFTHHSIHRVIILISSSHVNSTGENLLSFFVCVQEPVMCTTIFFTTYWLGLSNVVTVLSPPLFGIILGLVCVCVRFSFLFSSCDFGIHANININNL
jgi:hypothetical protein